MEKTPLTSDFPLRPIGVGETLVQVFRSAAEQSAAGQELDVDPGPESVPLSVDGDAARRQPGRSPLPSLQRRLYEADGHPVRLGRYDVVRCVGSGGMGVVYEATSVAHGQRVALKTLRWMTSTGLARFKNEFRSLCGVAHPNLVALYELGAEDGEWFFTMELVEGQSFLEHVQSVGERPLGGWEYLGETLDEVGPGVADGADDDGGSATLRLRLDESGVARRRGFHEGRLRAALRQLAAAVAALHDLGKLHRDLNPGNVLVTREGRVVVLDFGLISDRVRRPGAPFDGASGTPAYMSPEQAAGKAATPASDWYGFGVMLFEALTGQLPFTGSTLRMLTNKRHQEAPSPSALVSGLPPDLDELCTSLLRRAPERRPDGPTVLQRLGAAPRRARPSVPRDDACFTGRSVELAALAAAQRAASTASPVAVVIVGPAGMGKSRLCARFLDQLGASTVVLRGACRERETIPHRLLDAAVDALAVHLAALPPSEARSVLPPAARELARIFPVLESIDAIADLTLAPCDPDDAEASAFACLREILLRLAATRPVVLAIDDAHLGDREGARRLSALVAPPHPDERYEPGCPGQPEDRVPAAAGKGLLLVVTHASEEVERSPVLAELSRVLGDLRRVVLGPLSADEARDLARHALTEDGVAADAVAAASGGSPLAVEELALRFAEVGGEVSLDDAIAARLAGLPEPALRLLEVVATAATPIERSLLIAVAGAGPTGDAALSWLTTSRLVRVGGVRDGDRVRVHDERLRAIVRSRLPLAAAQQIHLDLGHALAARPDADPEETAACFQRAAAEGLAAEHLVAAAERAAAGRDHDRAAALWESARAGTPRGTARARSLSFRRAEALATAGRAAAAASAYLEDLAGAPLAEVLDRRRRAAEHLLVAGHVEEGLEALQQVLAGHDVRWPSTPRLASWALGARFVELRVRGSSLAGLEARQRPPPSAPPSREAPDPKVGAGCRIAALWSAGRALALLDPIRSSLFVVEALLAALAAGDAEQAALALSWVGSFLVDRGGADEARGLALIEEAARFARRSGDPYQLGFSWFCSGLARLSAGRFREALARVEESVALLETRGVRLTWEGNAHRAVCSKALFQLGALAERARRAEAWLSDARRRGDRAGEVHALLAVALAKLAGGDSAGARRATMDAIVRTGSGWFGVPHHAALWLEVSILLHEGDSGAARARLLASWPALRASQILRIQLVRIDTLLLRGLTAVAVGGAHLDQAEADAARLVRERRPYALASAALLRGGAARGRGEIALAASALDDASRGYASAEMTVHAAAARRARGTLLGGPGGRALVAEADATLAAEGVRDGARWAAMYTGIGYGSRRPSG